MIFGDWGSAAWYASKVAEKQMSALNHRAEYLMAKLDDYNIAAEYYGGMNVYVHYKKHGKSKELTWSISFLGGRSPEFEAFKISLYLKKIGDE